MLLDSDSYLNLPFQLNPNPPNTHWASRGGHLATAKLKVEVWVPRWTSNDTWEGLLITAGQGNVSHYACTGTSWVAGASVPFSCLPMWPPLVLEDEGVALYYCWVTVSPDFLLGLLWHQLCRVGGTFLFPYGLGTQVLIYLCLRPEGRWLVTACWGWSSWMPCWPLWQHHSGPLGVGCYSLMRVVKSSSPPAFAGRNGGIRLFFFSFCTEQSDRCLPVFFLLGSPFLLLSKERMLFWGSLFVLWPVCHLQL